MGKPTGFMDYERQTSGAEDPKSRIKHFNEFLSNYLFGCEYLNMQSANGASLIVILCGLFSGP